MIWCVLFLLAAEPKPAPTPTPVPAAPRRLGDVKLRARPDDAGRKLSSASGTAKPGSTDLPEREEVPKMRSVVRVPSIPEHRDRDGHGEAWWRERAARVRAELAAAETELRRAEADLDSAMPVISLNGPGAGALLYELQGRVDRARERAAKARRAEEDLREDARRADAWPGWLR